MSIDLEKFAQLRAAIVAAGPEKMNMYELGGEKCCIAGHAMKLWKLKDITATKEFLGMPNDDLFFPSCWEDFGYSGNNYTNWIDNVISVPLGDISEEYNQLPTVLEVFDLYVSRKGV